MRGVELRRKLGRHRVEPGALVGNMVGRLREPGKLAGGGREGRTADRIGKAPVRRRRDRDWGDHTAADEQVAAAGDAQRHRAVGVERRADPRLR